MKGVANLNEKTRAELFSETAAKKGNVQGLMAVFPRMGKWQ